MLRSGTISTLKSKTREKKLTSVCNGVTVTAIVFTNECWVGIQILAAEIKFINFVEFSF
jgi:hypothetical protein